MKFPGINLLVFCAPGHAPLVRLVQIGALLLLIKYHQLPNFSGCKTAYFCIICTPGGPGARMQKRLELQSLGDPSDFNAKLEGNETNDESN